MLGGPRDPPHNNHRPRRGQGVPVSDYENYYVMPIDPNLQIRRDGLAELVELNWHNWELPWGILKHQTLEKTLQHVHQALSLLLEHELVAHFYIGRSYSVEDRILAHTGSIEPLREIFETTSLSQVKSLEIKLIAMFKTHPKCVNSHHGSPGDEVDGVLQYVYLALWANTVDLPEDKLYRLPLDYPQNN